MNITAQKLCKLSEEHSYYASTCNFYSNDATGYHDTMTDFLTEFEDADIDYNLVYRWDASWNEDQGCVSVDVFIIAQRKGIYMPQVIESCTDEEAVRFVEYLKAHKAYGEKLWELPEPKLVVRNNACSSDEYDYKVLSKDDNRYVVELVGIDNGFDYANGKIISPVVVFDNDQTACLLSVCEEYILEIHEC